MGTWAKGYVRVALGLAGMSGAIAAYTPAWAQDTGTDSTASPIQDIIVTAERREQSLQDSSLSLQVLSADQLEKSNLTQASDLNTLVPGLQIGSGGNSPQIYIRGVGDFAASALSTRHTAVAILLTMRLLSR